MEQLSPLDQVIQTDLELEEIASEDEDLEIDEAPYEIRTLGADFTLELYSQKIVAGEIRIPEFQRKYVWTVKKASRLIESFLLGLPVPQVFLFQEPDKRDLLVVDGQQRLLAAHFFLRGTLQDETTKFTLKGVKAKWEGKLYSDLDEGDKRRLKNYILRATIFEQIDPSDNKSVYEIFERLNTGGMPLREQEIRNSVNSGTINIFLEKLNAIQSWRNLLGNQLPDRRMKDIELILRVLALVEGWQSYKPPMKDFISEYMAKYVDIDVLEQSRLEKLFESVTKMIADQVGPSAFHLSGKRLNVAVLDSVMTAVAIIGPEKIDDFSRRLEKLKIAEGYPNYVSKATTNDDSVTGRVKMSIQAFSGQD